MGSRTSEGSVPARPTPLEWSPRPSLWNGSGLDIPRADLEKLLEVDVEGWLARRPTASQLSTISSAADFPTPFVGSWKLFEAAYLNAAARSRFRLATGEFG